MTHPLILKGREQDLYFTDGENVVFIPQGWADEIKDPSADEPEMYGYAPTHTFPNSPVETLFVSCAALAKMEQVTREQAERIHPALFAELAKRDAE